MAANIHDDILHMPDQYKAHAELMEKKGIYYNMQKSQITT